MSGKFRRPSDRSARAVSRLIVFVSLVAVGVALWNLAISSVTQPPDHTRDEGFGSPPLAATPPEIVPHWPPRSGGDADPQRSAGWPHLFGPTHNSVSFETGIRTEWPETGPPRRWEREIGAGYSAPVALDDRVVVHYRRGDEEIVESLDARTGEARWTYAWPTTFKCKYEYSDGPYATPVLTHNRVYALGAEGRLHCLDFGSGELVWKRLVAEEFEAAELNFGIGASPLLEGDHLILNLGGRSGQSGIVALDKDTGETAWTATDHKSSYATPRAATIHGTRYLFVFTAQGLVCLDPASGHVHWDVPFGVDPDDPMFVNAVSPLIHEDLVLVVAGPGPGALCLRVLADGSYEQVWRDERVLDSQYNNLVCVNGYVYGYTSMKYHGRFRCLHLKTGALMWDYRSPLRRGSSLAVDGRLLLLGENGELAALDVNYTDPVVRAEPSRPVLAGPCYSAPALHRGRLYVRNEQALVCLELNQTGIDGDE